jgi:hypothetical protein
VGVTKTSPHLFLYLDVPPPHSSSSMIGLGDFELNLYLYKDPNNLILVILPAYTAYEDGTLFQNVGT